MPEAYAASIERLRVVAGTARDPDGHVFAVIAEYLRRDGRLDEAREALDEGRAGAPDFASGHLVAAQVLTELGDLEGARTALARVLELDRENGRAPDLGQALDAADETAALDWARAQGVGPSVEVDREVVTVTLGSLYLEQGAADRAEDVARQLLAQDSENTSAQSLLEQARAGRDPALEEAGAAAAAVDVAELAPDPTDVTQLAPDPVPIAELAPHAVAVATLAPVVVPVATLAPDPDRAAPAEQPKNEDPKEGEDHKEMDDFMSWLVDH